MRLERFVQEYSDNGGLSSGHRTGGLPSKSIPQKYYLYAHLRARAACTKNLKLYPYLFADAGVAWVEFFVVCVCVRFSVACGFGINCE